MARFTEQALAVMKCFDIQNGSPIMVEPNGEPIVGSVGVKCLLCREMITVPENTCGAMQVAINFHNKTCPSMNIMFNAHNLKAQRPIDLLDKLIGSMEGDETAMSVNEQQRWSVEKLRSYSLARIAKALERIVNSMENKDGGNS